MCRAGVLVELRDRCGSLDTGSGGGIIGEGGGCLGFRVLVMVAPVASLLSRRVLGLGLCHLVLLLGNFLPCSV